MGARGHVRGATMADDTEKAIIYAFDQSGDVPADLRERALGYLRDLQVRPGRLTRTPPSRCCLLGHSLFVVAASRRIIPSSPPHHPTPDSTPIHTGITRRMEAVRAAVPINDLPRSPLLVPPDTRRRD